MALAPACCHSHPHARDLGRSGTSRCPTAALPDLTAGYRREFDLRSQQLVAICRELLRPAALPVLIHCGGGKDRTGVVVELLLAITTGGTRAIASRTMP
jgi:protein-tyrosine phosphatase